MTIFHEVFRYRRDDEVRIYQLCAVPGGLELWRVLERGGEPAGSVKETDFRRPDEVGQFLEEVERTLTVGGWRQESAEEG
jgi:hypothetical protein